MCMLETLICKFFITCVAIFSAKESLFSSFFLSGTTQERNDARCFNSYMGVITFECKYFSHTILLSFDKMYTFFLLSFLCFFNTSEFLLLCFPLILSFFFCIILEFYKRQWIICTNKAVGYCLNFFQCINSARNFMYTKPHMVCKLKRYSVKVKQAWPCKQALVYQGTSLLVVKAVNKKAFKNKVWNVSTSTCVYGQ